MKELKKTFVSFFKLPLVLSLLLMLLLVSAGCGAQNAEVPHQIHKAAKVKSSKKPMVDVSTNYDFKVKITPPKVGNDKLALAAFYKGKRTTDLQKVSLSIKMVVMDMGTTQIQFPVKNLGKGTVLVKDTFLMPGRFLIHIHALTASYKVANKDIIVNIDN
ncbi:hypothetical protein [Sporolactobacillus pectinivorans]|uniref:hypothetical protein n=1 Tax=Sporolactobacillus pectinivorans TaxID=1591408 RepID=UPI000C265533|nr:hypothetical protein [Sporolactobacillus pectinivorans]